MSERKFLKKQIKKASWELIDVNGLLESVLELQDVSYPTSILIEIALEKSRKVYKIVGASEKAIRKTCKNSTK